MCSWYQHIKRAERGSTSVRAPALSRLSPASAVIIAAEDGDAAA